MFSNIPKWLPVLFILFSPVCLDNNRQQKQRRQERNLGYTNFYIRSQIRALDKKILEEEKNEIVDEIVVTRKPSRLAQPWRRVNIPQPLLLNDRFRNPKFISKFPKRMKQQQQQKNNGLLKTGMKEINGTRFKIKRRKKAKKVKHANILNTNYKYAFLARMKSKNKENSQRIISNSGNSDVLAPPLDIRIGL